jgi:hypothetical protein
MAEQKPILQEDKGRCGKYARNEQLFLGEHLDAFNTTAGDNLMKKEMQRLRYVVVNFAGMLSRLSADMLFGYEEYPRISFKDEKVGAWFEQFDFTNNLSVQMYENATENSYRGDGLLRLRSEAGKLIIEDINPDGWFPLYDKGNVRKAPIGHVLQWKTSNFLLQDEKGKPYEIIIQETHKAGTIETIAFLTNEKKETGRIMTESEMKILGLIPLVKTGVDTPLVFHVPNSRINSTFFGLDDYHDLLPLMYAINNRLTKIDNVLDKHGDPILAVPSGVLDSEGNVNKQAFGVIEVESGEGVAKPEYIVWDAKLESSFSMIDRLMEFLFMTSETSPSAFGLDKEGQAESGRALKFKMLRTLAKKHRKQAYYDSVLKKMIYVAQQFAIANGLECGGLKLTGLKAEIPQIEWQDGIINDTTEIMDIEERKLSNGLTSRVESLMRTEGITRKQAEERIKEAQTEEAEMRPKFGVNPFKLTDTQGGGDQPPVKQ